MNLSIRGFLNALPGEPLSFTQKDVIVRGHAIECRINAEDPETNFMPSPGQVTDYCPPGGFGVRVDSALYPGYHISMYYDSMIGKLVVWGRNREEAISRMRRSLKEFIIEGVTTTIPFHLLVLENEQFLNGEVYTNFIRKHIEEPPEGEDDGRVLTIAKIKRQLAERKRQLTAGSNEGQNLDITDIQSVSQPRQVKLTLVFEEINKGNEITAQKAGFIKEIKVKEGGMIRDVLITVE